MIMPLMNLKKWYSESDLQEFAWELQKLSEQIGFKVSTRGWAYILEQNRMINKDQFDKVTSLINKCRKKGYLPIDFVAEESARQFQGVEIPDENSVISHFGNVLDLVEDAAEVYQVDWWRGEEFYIQVVVEKIDLVTLFKLVCAEYHIPIANSKGWSSMLQRAEYAKRFLEAEQHGQTCVLLYCGDHDPDGLRISEFIRKNLRDLEYVNWGDGQTGYNPDDLIIDRFGLNYNFILENDLTWIDNLITGSGKNLASPKHPNFNMSYVQSYLKQIGERKCEANAIVTMPKSARELITEAIEKYLGSEALDRFESRRQAVRDELEEFIADKLEVNLMDVVADALQIIRERS